jgi:hypothetical protein
MAAKLAVGVPVHKEFDALLKMAEKTALWLGLRPPCAVRQLKQPNQSLKKLPPHIHCWCAAKARGEVPLGWQAASMSMIN